MLGVTKPFSSVNSSGTISNLRIDSAREASSLALLTARSTSARTMGFFEASSKSATCSAPLDSSHRFVSAKSREMIAAMNGLRSPIMTHWLTTGEVMMDASISHGETFLPPAVMMRSFLRPTMETKPSSSMEPRSPVCSHPSTICCLVTSGLLWYPAHTAGLFMHSSPSSSTPMVTPCRGQADGADLVAFGRIDARGGARFGHAVAFQ